MSIGTSVGMNVPVPQKKRVEYERPDFRVFIDEATGALTVTSSGYRFDKSITLTMDELPARYTAYFTKYLLCKDR